MFGFHIQVKFRQRPPIRLGVTVGVMVGDKIRDRDTDYCQNWG